MGSDAAGVHRSAVGRRHSQCSARERARRAQCPGLRVDASPQRQLPAPTKDGSGVRGGSGRAMRFRSVNAMMQDVTPDREVGKVALGWKHGKAEKLRPRRLQK